MTLKKEDVLRFIEGHTHANQLHDLERMKRLKFLTMEEARQEYESLCAVWQNPANPPFPERMWDRRLEQKLLLRSRLNKLGSGSPRS